MNRLLAAIPLAVTLFVCNAPARAASAVLQALDKVTARVAVLTVDIGKTARFGEIEITVRACVKRPPLEPPQTSVFLGIDEYHGETRSSVFAGWMFAEAPALHTLEDPVYDVRLLDCLADPVATPAVPAAPAKPVKPAG